MTEHHFGEVRLTLARSTGFTLEADVRVPSSGITVLFGPSGCGKTTVLRCVAGLERAVGRVVIGGNVWQDDEKKIFLPTYERSLGYVFQEASLFAHLNVEKNLTFGLERTKVEDGKGRLAKAVELLGIRHLLKRRVSELSGGERQRCAIARALCLTPDILLMDEPLAALDYARKREILPWLEKLRSELQIPILYVTHSADEMARLADELIVMQDGKVRAAGPLAEVLGNVKVPVETAYGSSVVLKGRVESVSTEWKSALIRTGGWVVDAVASGLKVGDEVRMRMLSRDVSVSLEKPRDVSIRNCLPATVVELGAETGPEGAYQIVKLAAREGEGEILARILRESAAELQLAPGKPVWALVKATAVIV
ncbi:molybdenum ABC transporter ATP-binding protein [Sutterella sp.]|uniref:molybdenum ABC transporter ATP-binding protein n=1 Tax=Sutterella sp. TaxID=1981025 RepID=UPI0026E090DC|nr:molybdenum ABC transporter ATP-binding protein [Sutterella sp.]MDO5530619.1 molybdenum ABC transporter ATP-binding protein [Sutterella sp.]